MKEDGRGPQSNEVCIDWRRSLKVSGSPRARVWAEEGQGLSHKPQS